MFRIESRQAQAIRLLVAMALLAASLLSGAAQVSAASDDPGAVYTMTNAAAGNEVMVFARAADGTLTSQGSVPTGGNGTGAGLGSQGSVILSADGRWLFVVNAGSNSISSFRVLPDGLVRVGTFPSGGVMPISLTVYGDLLYALNAGGSGNIAGFRMADSVLTPIPGSMQPLSSNAAGPAQIQFNASGTVLVVTEKATNRITTYTVGSDGVAAAPVSHPSAGPTPFGFDIDRQDHVVVSEAAGGAPNATSTSSYALGSDGSVAPISRAVASGQTAACWVVISKNGRFAYVANAGTSNLSSYSIAEDGALTLLEPSVPTAPQPLDLAISNSGRFLYALAGAGDVIVGFRVESDGSLTLLEFETPIAPTAIGLAAR